MRDQKSNNYLFAVTNDRTVFNTSLIPSICMEYDNDIESEWPQIHEAVEEMGLSLRVAAFDRTFGYDWIFEFIIYRY